MPPQQSGHLGQGDIPLTSRTSPWSSGELERWGRTDIDLEYLKDETEAQNLVRLLQKTHREIDAYSAGGECFLLLQPLRDPSTTRSYPCPKWISMLTSGT